MENEMEPCPFCGGKAIKWNRVRYSCRDCGAQGPYSQMVQGPENRWNTRFPRDYQEWIDAAQGVTTASQRQIDAVE